MLFKEFYKYTYLKEEHTEYLKELQDFIAKNSKYLPKYHIYPKSGLMNDPNGLAYFNNEYHFFYQWFPFEAKHGMKHWGHSKSKDLMHWEDCPVALIPDQEYEKNGCYSGNAIEKDGLLHLFYTANYKDEKNNDKKIGKQALAIMDKQGKIIKYNKNPILAKEPEGFSGELRDPFVFQREGSYYMLLGGQDLVTKTGALLVYTSNDLLEWNFLGTVKLPIATGYMLECPSLAQVDGKDVLILSPMGLNKEKHRFHNEFSSIYLIGNLNLKELSFEMDFMDQIDSGFDFYAPQTFYNKNNKAQMVGWFGCGEQKLPSDTEMWKHSLTLCRELSIIDGKLRHFVNQESLKSFHNAVVQKGKELALENSYYHFEVKEISIKEDFEIKLGNSEDYLIINFNSETAVIQVSRSKLKIAIDDKIREVVIDDTTKSKGQMSLDIFVDNSFVEVYFNKGEYVFSVRTFNLNDKHRIISSQELDSVVKYWK